MKSKKQPRYDLIEKAAATYFGVKRTNDLIAAGVTIVGIMVDEESEPMLSLRTRCGSKFFVYRTEYKKWLKWFEQQNEFKGNS